MHNRPAVRLIAQTIATYKHNNANKLKYKMTVLYHESGCNNSHRKNKILLININVIFLLYYLAVKLIFKFQYLWEKEVKFVFILM